MDNINKTGGLWNVVISLGATVMAVGLALVTGSITALAVAILMSLGFLVSVASLLHMHLVEREGQEDLEVSAIQTGRGGETLFKEGEVLPAKRSREQFERWGVPVVAILLLGLQGLGVYHLAANKLAVVYENLTAGKSLHLVSQMYLGLAGSALLAVILFVRGQFASNLARIQRDRLLQPASDSILFSAYLLFVLAAVMAVSFREQRIDAWVGTVMACLMAVLVLENLLSMIFEIYRPRVSGRKGRLLYQSRLVGLIAKPENLFTTAGKVLDYQFGFKVSETWGYQFLRERLGVLVGVQIIIFWLSTSVVIIEPSERGRKLDILAGSNSQAQWLDPGIHFKLPWPFADVERYHPDQVHSFYVGLEPDENADDSGARLWLKRAGKDYESLQKTGELYFPTGSGDESGAANLVVPSIPVHYRIYEVSPENRKNLESGWLNFSDPEGVLKNLAYREVSRYFLGDTMGNLLRAGREQAIVEIKKNLQASVDVKGLGVEILYVGLADLRPPAESPSLVAAGGPNEKDEMDPGAERHSQIPVAMAFESYLIAGISKWKIEYLANSLKQQIESVQTNEVETILHNANMEAKAKIQMAEARMNSSRLQNNPFRNAPFIYPIWLQMRMFERSLTHARKFVVVVKNAEITSDIDLKETIRRGMLEVEVPDNK
jgi:hypothetical protein